jgi:hypothetical protein
MTEAALNQDGTADINTLDSIIKGQTEPIEQEAQPEPEAKVEKTGTTPEGEESWTKAMGLAERKKRQELEAKLAKYEQGEKEKKDSPKRPDVLEDQEGAFQQTESAFANAILAERINLSRELMIGSKDDYEEMEAIFVDMAKENPHLVIEMNQSPNPAKFAYSKAKEHTDYLEFQKTKDSEDWKEFLEAKKSGKFEKPVEETPAQKRNKAAVKTPDLINATSAKSGAVEGEKSLKQILGR